MKIISKCTAQIHFQISRCFMFIFRWPITMLSFLSHSRMARLLLPQSYKTAAFIVGFNANLAQIGIILRRETQMKSCSDGLSWCGKTLLHLHLLVSSNSSQDKKRCDREMLILLLSSWPSLLPFALPSTLCPSLLSSWLPNCPLGLPFCCRPNLSLCWGYSFFFCHQN